MVGSSAWYKDLSLLGQSVLSRAGLKATHPTRQVGSLPLANNVKHSPSSMYVSGIFIRGTVNIEQVIKNLTVAWTTQTNFFLAVYTINYYFLR